MSAAVDPAARNAELKRRVGELIDWVNTWPLPDGTIPADADPDVMGFGLDVAATLTIADCAATVCIDRYLPWATPRSAAGEAPPEAVLRAALDLDCLQHAARMALRG